MLMVTSRPVRLRSPSIIISCEASNESIDGAARVIEVRVLLLVLITTNRYSIYTMGYRIQIISCALPLLYVRGDGNETI